MFGIDLGSFIVIMIVAIIFLGPEKLPDVIIQVVKFFKSFKSTVQEAKDTIQKEIDLHELKNTATEYKEKLEKLTENLNNPSSMYNNKEVSDMFGDITKEFKEIEDGIKKEIESPLDTTPQISQNANKEEVK
ncbi:MAG: twin-arginine translocase subunit TatB [Campylobacteraceae bacterium]|jgi:sec-independent protein translocase protein TatB|nr:twin-arginine translocase subunit TatB [Campylobacteraceae bacterium]